MRLAVVFLANRSLPLWLYDSDLNGASVEELGVACSRPVDWVKERIEAVRLCVKHQVTLSMYEKPTRKRLTAYRNGTHLESGADGQASGWHLSPHLFRTADFLARSDLPNPAVSPSESRHVCSREWRTTHARSRPKADTRRSNAPWITCLLPMSDQHCLPCSPANSPVRSRAGKEKPHSDH